MTVETIELPEELKDVAHTISRGTMELCIERAAHITDRELQGVAIYAGLIQALGSFLGAFGQTSESAKESLDLYLVNHANRDEISEIRKSREETKH